MEIFLEYENCDMLPWMKEKIESIITSCYNILEHSLDEKCKDNAYMALRNALKIKLAFYNKLDVCNELLRFFLNNNYIEYQKWNVLITDLDRDKKHDFSEKGPIDKELLSLITKDGWDRSRIPEKINQKKAMEAPKNEWLVQLEDDYERMAMGEMTWQAFYECHSNDYEKYVCSYSFNDFVKMIEEKNTKTKM